MPLLQAQHVIACLSINCLSEPPLDSYQEPISFSYRVHWSDSGKCVRSAFPLSQLELCVCARAHVLHTCVFRAVWFLSGHCLDKHFWLIDCSSLITCSCACAQLYFNHPSQKAMTKWYSHAHMNFGRVIVHCNCVSTLYWPQGDPFSKQFQWQWWGTKSTVLVLCKNAL